jgi:hypothetical protein
VSFGIKDAKLAVLIIPLLSTHKKGPARLSFVTVKYGCARGQDLVSDIVAERIAKSPLIWS